MIISPALTLLSGDTLVCDFDDVFYPANSGTHTRVRELITQSVTKDLGPDSILATIDQRGHFPYFPQYVLYKYIQAGRNAENPDFITAMETCLFGEDTQNPDHYKAIGPNPDLRAQIMRLQADGIRTLILSSGPYNPHIKRILSQLGIDDLYPRENIYDVTRMCALYTNVTLDDFKNPTDEKLLLWLKPRRENYLAMKRMAKIGNGQTLYLEDNDVNGSTGVTATPLSRASTQAFYDQFGQSTAGLGTHVASDHWGWINLPRHSLREGLRPPVIEGRSLLDVLTRIQLAPTHYVTPRRSIATRRRIEAMALHP